jgi:hypothetical protein
MTEAILRLKQSYSNNAKLICRLRQAFGTKARVVMHLADSADAGGYASIEPDSQAHGEGDYESRRGGTGE